MEYKEGVLLQFVEKGCVLSLVFRMHDFQTARRRGEAMNPYQLAYHLCELAKIPLDVSRGGDDDEEENDDDKD
uniref:Uncharacterized protein n=1 Tax=Oryza glaberrima TaxID=4538 RepID=I1QXN0_ORYGL